MQRPHPSDTNRSPRARPRTACCNMHVGYRDALELCDLYSRVKLRARSIAMNCTTSSDCPSALAWSPDAFIIGLIVALWICGGIVGIRACRRHTWTRVREAVVVAGSPCRMTESMFYESSTSGTSEIVCSNRACAGDDAGSCSVCLSDLIGSGDVTQLACGHCFHTACIKSWMVGRQCTCPICRDNSCETRVRLRGGAI